ncbi:hypothetical protein CBR_g11055 [Chara braunii]|uniref:Cytochrome b561 domain-containing protein n=1 Tax=Chara braunii TaxID=69332 RepID=A0A388KQ05_CHABU|nr:hypothetical protein CBR_g11055 [Chara braunii]|eukprot:GBG72122.1 hypothetical protein CBR_g11055 [Chara braunii]
MAFLAAAAATAVLLLCSSVLQPAAVVVSASSSSSAIANRTDPIAEVVRTRRSSTIDTWNSGRRLARLAMAASRRRLLQAATSSYPTPPSVIPTSSDGHCAPPAATSTLSDFVCMSDLGGGASFHWSLTSANRDPNQTVRIAFQVQKPVFWMSVGWSPNGQMAGDCVIYSSSSSDRNAPGPYRILAKSKDGIVPSDKFQVLDSSVDAGDSETTLRFGRRFSDGAIRLAHTGPNRMIWAHSVPSTASSFSFHGPYAGSFVVDFSSGSVNDLAPASRAIESSRYLYFAHAWAMWMAFGVTFPIGMFIARYGKTSIGDWFNFHVGCQTASVLLSTIAAVISLVAFDALDTVHGRLGLAVMIMSWFQPLMAMARPHKGVRLRLPWYVQHWLFGTGAVVLGILNVFFGIDAFAARMDDTWTSRMASLKIAFSVEVAFLFFLYLCLNDWRYILSQRAGASPPPTSPKPRPRLGLGVGEQPAGTWDDVEYPE